MPCDVPVDFAEQFRHDLLSRNSAIDRHSMVSIGRDHPVIGLSGGDKSGGYRFLTDIQVHEAADFALLIKFCSTFFHATDQHHLMIEFELVFFIHR